MTECQVEQLCQSIIQDYVQLNRKGEENGVQLILTSATMSNKEEHDAISGWSEGDKGTR